MSVKGPFTRLPQPPRDRNGISPHELAKWFDRLWLILSGIPGISWDIVDKEGSELTDIETRLHSMLQSILGSGQNHISQSENDEITAIDAVTSGLMAKAGNAAYSGRTITPPAAGITITDGDGVAGDPTLALANDLAAVEGLATTGIAARTAADTWTTRTITGTIGEITVVDGDGVAGEPTLSLPDVIVTPRSFGDGVNMLTVEADGTLVNEGDATGWRDIHFMQAPPKTTGAGNPTLVTWLGNLQGYSYGINDAYTFDPQEYDHAGQVGATATWHIHFIAQSVLAGDKYNFSLEYTQSSYLTTYPATTTISAEYTMPAGAVAPFHVIFNVGTFTTLGPGSQMWVRLKRMAKTAGGTDPASDPVVAAVQYHYPIDTPSGSRTISTK